MKKLYISLFSLLMALTLVGCSSGKKEEGKTPEAETPEIVDLSTVKGSTTDFTYIYTSDYDRLDYLATNKATNNEHNANFVDGLLENDSFGNYIPAVAESYSSNEDSTVWTFKLRKGVKWVTSDGEDYAETTADDFVAGLQHAVDANSETLTIVQDLIVGLDDYVNGKVGFDQVGVKAIDEYTLEYSLTKPAPYFDTLTTYSIMLPANRAFLSSKGCVPGGDQTNCTFGGTTPDSILYNGPFILTANDAKSKITFIKNEKYWDVQNVHIDTVTFIYDDGSDAYSVMKGFQSGSYAIASLQSAWADYQSYADKFATYKTLGLPNAYSFGIQINFNRKNFNYTNKTAEEQKAASEAILNKNVRLALQAAFDTKAQMMTGATEEVAKANLRNTVAVGDMLKTTDGKTYGQLITEAYNRLTGLNYDLSDERSAYFNPEKAREYIAAAEADGIVFPIKLDVLIPNDVGAYHINKAESFKKSVEEHTDGKIIIDVQLQPYDVLASVAFSMGDPATAADYDLNTFAGWGPDYLDPMTFAHIYVLEEGEYMKNVGLLPTGNAEEDIKIDEIAAAVGFAKYTEMVNAADAIVDPAKIDERYLAFAEAEAYLLSQGLYLPANMQTRREVVTRVIPFTRPRSLAGLGDRRLKFMKLSETVITKEQFDAAKEAWLAGK